MQELLKDLRQRLHRHPEISGEEIQTAEYIREFIQKHSPGKVIGNIGGNGLAVIYEFSEGPVIMIRCELDALPIEEANNFEYRSQNKGISHKCGHDGHMAIVAGLGIWIKEQHFTKGKIILLFQPAEETGKGAAAVLNDPQFTGIKPDYIFALHNLPGEKLHSVIWVDNYFSATVQSFALKLEGKQSHASEPENGINPALAISELINCFNSLNHPDCKRSDFKLLTPVHISMGENNYGISPGAGEVHYTIRTWSESSMNALKKEILKITDKICLKYHLQFAIEWLEYFPATVNNVLCNNYIKKAATGNNLELFERPYPFKFGEDFGWFSRQHKAAMFGIGAGAQTPALHHNIYDFPDEIIETGIKMFGSIISNVLKVED